jgi:hypothetical protein
MLGYESPAELQAVGGVLGVFANPEEQARAFGSPGSAERGPHDALFRRKDGCQQYHRTIVAEGCEGAVSLAVFDRVPARPG